MVEENSLEIQEKEEKLKLLALHLQTALIERQELQDQIEEYMQKVHLSLLSQSMDQFEKHGDSWNSENNEYFQFQVGFCFSI